MSEATRNKSQDLLFLEEESDDKKNSSEFPHGKNDGIITHVDESGTETALFLDHSSQYSTVPPLLVVQHNSVDRLDDPNMFQGISNPPPIKSSGHIDVTDSNLLTNPSSEQISVSNMEAFPFTLTVESSQD